MHIPDDITLVAAADWWEILAGIIFFVLYGLGQLLSARDEAKKKAPPRPQRPPQPQQPRPAPPMGGGAPPNQADPLRAEVEEFLRRAQGKPAEQRRPAPPQPAPPRQIPPRRPQPATVSRPGKPARPPSRPPLRTPAPEPVEVEVRMEGVAEHVARHVVTEVQAIADRTKQLGAEVAQADDRLEAHLQDAFQHPIGSLEHREQGAAKQRPQTIAEEIRQLMRQPAGMRQLIIAGEILRRPEERW